MTTKKTPAGQAVRSTPLLCDRDCNHCPLVIHPNTRLLSALLNQLYDRFGEEVYRMVETACPNLTCCADCHIDDFCHVEGCEIVKHNAPDQARRQPSPEAGCSPRSVLRRLARVDISNPSDRLPAQRRVRDATDSSWNKTAERIHSALDANAENQGRKPAPERNA